MWLRPDQITNTEAVCFVEEEEEVVANAKFRPDQITNTKSSALIVEEEEEEEEAMKPNVGEKIGFRDNRVGWLKFGVNSFQEE